jgi:hypothetical protein
LHATAAREEQWEIEKNLDAWSTRLQKWAENSPHNFKAQHLIVAAEFARITGRDTEALNLYEAAIAAAANQECPRERAQQTSSAPSFGSGADWKIARAFMEEACYAYAHWGALAKAKDLERRYPQLLSSTRAESRTPVADNQTSQLTIGRRLESLDLQTVIKASQIISGEITLARLLEKLMRIVIENAGAQKGTLILKRDKNDKEGKKTEDEIVLSVPAESNPQFSAAVVNYVRRTCESLVLANAARDSRLRTILTSRKTSRNRSSVCRFCTKAS